jgi:glycine/D-amino acid oxidase-like deaminating enzyme
MSSPWPLAPPTAAHRAAYADAVPSSYWLEHGGAPDRFGPLEGRSLCDLCIVGGGFSGLWAALHAKAGDPARDVVVLESETVGHGASGRNGGFVSSSLTHGIGNGIARFPDEIETLERLGRENYDGFCSDLAHHGIECELESTGELTVALSPHEVRSLAEESDLLRRFGHDVEWLGAEQMRAEVASPLYHGGLWDRTGTALVDPGKLVFGLRAAAARLGVRIHEGTPARSLVATAGGVEVATPNGVLHARGVLLATSAYPGLLRPMRRYIAPVYDYVLVTEPLSAEQLASIAWSRRQGLADAGNQFHYYRRTADDRLLWGGYDAVYRFGGPVAPRFDVSETSFARLSQHFFTNFPQLEGLRFSHRWGGAIDTCSRFAVFFGTAHGGRVAYATGYTGLGVCASRFGARVALDLLDGRRSEATALRYVRRKPVPFPPEPLRWAVIALTRNRLAAADRHEGRRGAWLKLLDRLGLGFDS